MSKLSHILVFVPFIFLGLYTRLEGIFAGTFGFTHDQGRDLLAAYEQAHGNLTLIGPTTGLAGVFHGPLWYFLLGIFSFLGRGDPKFILACIVFLFLVIELALFFAIKKYVSYFASFIFLAVVLISPFFTSFNEQLWSPSMILLSMMLTVLAIIKIVNGKRWFWLLGLALGLNLQFEAAGGVFILLSLILTYFLIGVPKFRWKDAIVSLLTFGATLVPHLLFEIRHGFLMTKIFLDYSALRRADFIAQYGVKSVEYKTGLFFDNFYKLLFQDNLILTLIFILVVLFFITRIKKFQPTSKPILLWCFSMLFSLWFFTNLYFDVVWYHFIFGTSVLYVLIIALVFENSRRYIPKLTYGVLFLLISIMVIPMARGLNKQKGIVGDHSFYKNQLSIIDTIYADAGGEPFNVEVYEPTTFGYNYQYLFTWYVREKFGYFPVPNETHTRLAYFIIEPDSTVGRREKWVQERDGDGEILWEKEYWKQKNAKTGLTLQKRLRDNL